MHSLHTWAYGTLSRVRPWRAKNHEFLYVVNYKRLIFIDVVKWNQFLIYKYKILLNYYVKINQKKSVFINMPILFCSTSPSGDVMKVWTPTDDTFFIRARADVPRYIMYPRQNFWFLGWTDVRRKQRHADGRKIRLCLMILIYYSLTHKNDIKWAKQKTIIMLYPKSWHL